MATTIVLTNQKGGVGKTTTSCALAAGLCKKGKRVLSVDLDPQGNLGFSLGLGTEDGRTIYEVLKGELLVWEGIRRTESYGDVLTSNILLSETETFPQGPKQLLLKDALAPVQCFYDYIVIDTPPSLNILTINAYAAADFLVIPMAAEILSLVGLVQLKDTVDAVKKSVNPELCVLGILLTRFNQRTTLAKEVADMASTVAAQIGTEVLEAKIRNGVVVAEAPAHGLSIYDYALSSNPSKDYQKFVDEILGKIIEHKEEG